MPSRVIGTVVTVQTGISGWPTTFVVMHDDGPPCPYPVAYVFDDCRCHPEWAEPPEIAEARAILAANPPTVPVVDHFAEARRG